MKLIALFDELLERISRYGLILGFLGILFLATWAIVMRWLGQGLLWIDPLVRHLVFTCAFFGGSLATKKNVHIKIDIFTKLFERPGWKFLLWPVHNMVSLFSFVVCLMLMKSGIDLYVVEKEFGAPSFLEIHSAYLVGIIPMGMGLICLRFLNKLILGLRPGEQK
jgi:TRAP-type C4-dicarboxylate transport system permease small subunit